MKSLTQDPENVPGSEVCEGDTHGIRTLVYHRITDNQSMVEGNSRCVHETEFRRHLDLLDRWGYTTITFRDYQLFLGGRLHLPKKPIILTMDGGFPETYRSVFGVLREYGAKAVVFVLAGSPFRDASGAMELAASSQMSVEQLREMSAEGIEIGSLSVTHANLLSLPVHAAREEIVRSKDALERDLDTPVISFAYPFGLVNETIKSMVIEARYAFACGWSSGPSRIDADPYEIRRLSIRHDMGALEFGFNVRAPHVARSLWRSRS